MVFGAMPLARDDTFRTDEDQLLLGNVLADNGAGPDVGPSGADPVVVAVNGMTASLGDTVRLASGALLTVAADGTFTYDPNGMFDSLAIGASAEETFTYTIVGEGVAPAFPASIDVDSLDGTDGFGISFGSSIASIAGVGDVNADGYDDIIAGMPAGYGRARVIYGSADGFGGHLDATGSLDPSVGFDIVGGYGSDRIADGVGAAVDAVGDYNGDGIDDILVGAPDSFYRPGSRYGYASGRAFIVYGTASDRTGPVDVRGLLPRDGVEFTSGQSSAGDPVAGAGDVNGDGFRDVVIADNGYYRSGRIDVVFGPGGSDLTQLDGTNGFTFKTEPYAYTSVTAGDLNGDGLSDVVIGVYNYNTAVYVVFGSTDPFPGVLTAADLDGDTGFALTDNANDYFGSSVSLIGDVNGDGVDDLAIGASLADNDAGLVYVVYGSKTGFDASVDVTALSGADGFVIAGGAPQEEIGTSVSNAGDVNGDGLSDFIIAGTTKAYVVFGSADGFPAELDLAALDGTNGFVISRANAAIDLVAAAGDVNADGIDDLLVKSGSDAFVLYGGAQQFANGDTATVTITVDGTGAAPFARDDTYAIDEDTTIAAGPATGVLANDTDSAGDTLTASLLGGPAHAASFKLNADGSFTYVPISEFSGTDTFTYKVTDQDHNSDTATATITVAPVNDPPVAHDDTARTTADHTVAGNVLTGPGADTDVENDPLAVAAVNGVAYTVGTPVTLPSGAIVTLQADGSFVYDPNGAFDSLAAGHSATDSFDYVVTDAPGGVLPNPFGSQIQVGDLAPPDATPVTVHGGFGQNLTDAGDVDGDGLDDILVTNGYFGKAVAVVYGKSGGFGAGLDPDALGPDDKTTLLTLPGQDDRVLSAQAAGDVDNDGFADVLILADTATGKTLYLASGAGDHDFTLKLLDSHQRSGFPSIAPGGDINGDGFDDILIGDSYALGTRGTVQIRFGSAAGLPSTAELDVSNSATIRGDRFYDTLGATLAAVGDVNGDGFDDFVAGGAGYYANGATNLIFGGQAFEDKRLASLQHVDLGQDITITAAGDINGDGFDDFLGLQDDNGPGLGRVYDYYGTFIFLGGPGNQVTTIPVSHDNGHSYGFPTVAALGDINGDGFADSFFGSNVIFGSPELSAAGGGPLDGSLPIERGSGAEKLGDVDGDGIDDFFIYQNGQRYIVYGRPTFDPGTTDVGTVTVTIDGAAMPPPTGTNGNDTLVGSRADDTLDGRGGDDLIKGSNGDDLLKGSNGDDTLNGGNGLDTLNGGGGNDRLLGSAGDDVLIGGFGADNVIGNAGDDRMSGGAGRDTFAVSAAGGASRDVIMDFDDGEEIVKLHGLSVTDVSDGPNGAILTFDNGGTLVLRHVLASHVDASDFQFSGGGGFLP